MLEAAFSALLLLQAPSARVSAERPADAGGLAVGVRAMIEAAVRSGDAKAVETVTALARETNPSAGAEIDDLVAQWRVQLANSELQKKQEVTAAAANVGDWKGQVELGASRSTGRTSYLGAVGAISLEREGARWRHKMNARLEVQKGPDVAEVERLVASWQPNYKFGDELYVYGLGQIEADPSQEYQRRYTLGGGLGYTILSSATAKLDFEGGPAFRRVRRTVNEPRSSLAARASMNLRWAIAPTMELKQASALFLEPGNRNATALTSLDAQILGPLKARLSYDVRYEDRLSDGAKHLDTLSRATLVYSF